MSDTTTTTASVDASALPAQSDVATAAEVAGGATALTVIRVAAVALSAFHGYRRNKSIGWAVGWAFVAGLFPTVTIGIAAAQGFGQPYDPKKPLSSKAA